MKKENTVNEPIKAMPYDALLCAGLCLNCKHQSYKSDKTFAKTGICLVKFWKDKRYKLSKDKPVLKCEFFEPCT